MTKANGYFIAFINARAYKRTEEDGRLIRSVTEAARRVLGSSQVQWAGSLRKGTAIEQSDLDLCVESTLPVSVSQRRELATVLRQDLRRPADPLSHVIRLPEQGANAKVDIAFANAAFGGRPLPDASVFSSRPSRQHVVRAVKLWTRSGALPRMPGWVVEALTVFLDSSPRELSALELFDRVVDWFVDSANPSAMETILRRAAFPCWNPAWSATLPGRLEAVQNSARRLSRRRPLREAWTRADDVAAWLRE